MFSLQQTHLCSEVRHGCMGGSLIRGSSEIVARYLCTTNSEQPKSSDIQARDHVLGRSKNGIIP